MKLKNRFNKYTDEGQLFIKLWNKNYKTGIQRKLADKFSISMASVYRVRKMLKLPDLKQNRKKILKRIVYLYFTKEKSTENIGKIIGYSSANIQYILKKNNFELRDRSYSNIKLYKTRNKDYTPNKLLNKIKEMYYNGHTITNISKTLKIDTGTVSNKLKAMNIKIKKPALTKSNIKCLWCNKPIKCVNASKGARKQKYCSGRCSSKAKDLRKIIRKHKTSRVNYDLLFNELKNTHKDNYNNIIKEIMNVKPCIKK